MQLAVEYSCGLFTRNTHEFFVLGAEELLYSVDSLIYNFDIQKGPARSLSFARPNLINTAIFCNSMIRGTLAAI